jgi:hypothetical protein
MVGRKVCISFVRISRVDVCELVKSENFFYFVHTTVGFDAAHFTYFVWADEPIQRGHGSSVMEQWSIP